MRKINMVFIHGNVTREPELKFTPSGTPILLLGIAWNKNRKDANGEWQSEPNFFDVKMFGSDAEKVSALVHKGTEVQVVGELRQERWQDNNGNNRSKCVIIATSVVAVSKDAPVADSQGNFSGASDDDGVPF